MLNRTMGSYRRLTRIPLLKSKRLLNTFAHKASGSNLVSRGTAACKASRSVNTATRNAKIGKQQAFVDIFATEDLMQKQLVTMAGLSLTISRINILPVGVGERGVGLGEGIKLRWGGIGSITLY